jgi:CheY-like chemotaxis protein
MMEQPDPAAGNAAGNVLMSERPLRILLAEDNSVTREVMLMMLSSLGYQADIVANGLEAIEAAGRHSYDVVLMDVRMPELDGLQAAKLIRAHTGSPVEPWIVAMTADEETSDRKACLAAGMNGFLAKPVRTDDLASLLGRIVANHAAQIPEDPAPGKNGGSRIQNFVDRDHARPLCEAYVADARATVSDLIAHAGTHDFDAVRRKAHYLKGSSMIVGASRVTSLCREVEARATAQQPVEEVLDALRQAVEATAAAFEDG